DYDLDSLTRSRGTDLPFAQDAESLRAGTDSRGDLLENVPVHSRRSQEPGDVRKKSAGLTVGNDRLRQLAVNSRKAGENLETGGVDVNHARQILVGVRGQIIGDFQEKVFAHHFGSRWRAGLLGVCRVRARVRR